MEDNLDAIITKNIKREIENCGLSKSEIARRLGVSKPTVSQYLSGRAQPTLATFARLCKIIDCSSDDILNLKNL